MTNTTPAPAATFDFMGAFTALVAKADRFGRGGSFPELHEVCIDRSAVVELGHLPGAAARVERYLDAVEAVSRRYGWSVDEVGRILGRF